MQFYEYYVSGFIYVLFQLLWPVSLCLSPLCKSAKFDLIEM